MRITNYILNFIIVFFFYSCYPEINDPDTFKPTAFYGKVINEDEETVPFVEIHIGYRLKDISVPAKINTNISQNYPNPFIDSTNINYTLTDRGVVILSLFDFNSNEMIYNFLEKEQFSGSYTLNLNLDTLVTNGLYLLDFKFEDIQGISDYHSTLTICKNDTTLSEELFSTEPFFTTTEDGTFIISYDKFNFGKKIIKTLANNPESLGLFEIQDQIIFLINKEGYQPLKKVVSLDTTKIYQTTFILNKE